MIDLEEVEPCGECGNKCPTQVSGIDVNGNIPWRTCDACHVRTGTIGEAQESESVEP